MTATVALARWRWRRLVKVMKRMPTEDDCFGRGTWREGGQDRCPGGLDKLLATARAKEAFHALEGDGGLDDA